MTTPPTEQQLDEIETRAAHLHEYALLDDEPMQADADQLTGTDVPLLLAEVRRQREKHKASLRRADEINNELMAEVQRYAAGTERPVLWSVYNRMHLRAANAEARVAELAAVHAFLDEQELAARAFELPTPAWVEAVRAASVPPEAPVRPSQPSSVSESAQSPTGAPA